MITVIYEQDCTYPELYGPPKDKQEKLKNDLIRYMLDNGWTVHVEAYYRDFFPTDRKWRADIIGVMNEHRIAVIEIQGGSWVFGRHNRPRTYQDDLRKANLVNSEGHSFFAYTYDMLEAKEYETHLI